MLIGGLLIYFALATTVHYGFGSAILEHSGWLNGLVPHYTVSNALVVAGISTLIMLLIRIAIQWWQVWSFRNNPAQLVRPLVNDELELFLLDALEMRNVEPSIGQTDDLETKRLLVRLVLDNRKVYIGNIARCDLTMGVCSNVSIIPMHSGYQDEQTLELKLKEHYERHYAEVLKENPDISQLFNQFEIVIPVERIVSASLFEIDAFIHFLEMKISQLESKTRTQSQTYPVVPENISYG